MKSGIYYIQNIDNGKLYIGSAVNIEKRWREHKHHLYKRNHVNAHLQAAWDKDGEDIFIFGILEIVSDKYALLDREQYWIDKFKVIDNKYGYNKAPVAGSTLGMKQSDETKEKLRKVGFQKGFTPWNKGKKMEGEYKENHLKASAKRKGVPSTRKEFKHTEASKKKISEAGRGRKCSEETKKKKSIIMTGKKLGEDHRKNCIKAWEKRKLKKQEEDKLCAL